MITSTHCSCLITGTTFSPRSARMLDGLDLNDPIEPMSLGKRGRYKGVPDPNGSAEIVVPLYEKTQEALAVLKKLSTAKDALRSLGASVTVYMTFGYRGQCNWELSPEVVTALAELRCTVCVSCFEDSRTKDG
jgi:hypothetical protein